MMMEVPTGHLNSSLHVLYKGVVRSTEFTAESRGDPGVEQGVLRNKIEGELFFLSGFSLAVILFHTRLSHPYVGSAYVTVPCLYIMPLSLH